MLIGHSEPQPVRLFYCLSLLEIIVPELAVALLADDIGLYIFATSFGRVQIMAEK